MTQEIVFLTGASRGIGAATARAFVAAGAKVALLARSRRAIEALAADLGDAALPILCDVADFAAVQRAVAETEAALGPISVVVNNAATLDPIAHLAESDPADWGRLIDVNVKGVYHGIRASLPGMLARGGGSVLTISSGAAHKAYEGWSAYCASKAAVAMLTQSLHHEYGGQGIRAMGLSPGTVATQMQRDIKASGIGPVAALDWEDHIPPEWVARALVWMAGAAADDLCGQELRLRDADLLARIGLQ